jgi:hypothetical protein
VRFRVAFDLLGVDVDVDVVVDVNFLPGVDEDLRDLWDGFRDRARYREVVDFCVACWGALAEVVEELLDVDEAREGREANEVEEPKEEKDVDEVRERMEEAIVWSW